MYPTERTSTPSAPATARQPRKRRQSGRSLLPARTSVRILDGGAAMEVALHGKHGRGKAMILDGRDWHRITTTIGDVWGVNPNGQQTHGYVRCGASRVAYLAGQQGGRPTASLARILTDATAQQVVLYRDGNTLNLRRANLEVVSRSEAMRRRASRRAA